MIVHIAIFEWKEGFTQNDILNSLEKVQSLKNKIDGIDNILVGENYSRWAKNFSHAVVVLAKNQKALDNYRNHPDHLVVANQIDIMEKDGIGFDFKDIKFDRNK